jgi:hypothetical protein
MTSKTVAPSAVWFGQPLVPSKAPVKKNLFEEVIHATGTLELAPVFPYLHNGAIVPCLSVSLGGNGARRFQFFQDNVAPVDWRSVDTSQQIPQEAYREAAQVFNADAGRRTCRHCGTVHPFVDLGDIAWPAVAAAIRRAQG